MEWFYRNSLLLLMPLALMTHSVSAVSAEGDWTQGRIFDHFITIVLENTDYSDAIRDPYFKSLMQKGALLSNFNAIMHPSYPNYLAMVAGSTFGIWSDKQKTINAPSIADLLEAKNLTWKGYAEAYPGDCFIGDSKGTFARKHVPFLSFKSIQNDPARCAQIVAGEQFQKDWKARQIPNYAFFSPDMDDDGHDTDLATASKWLKKFLTPLLSDTEGMSRTLIEVTFDESGAKVFGSNQICTLFIGPMVKPGVTVNTDYNHYNVLRTVEENFALGTLGTADKSANTIQGIWVN